MKRNKVLLCLLAVLLMLLPERALAAGSIDLAKDVSLTVTAFYDQKAVSGMQFDAYLIANVDDCGELTVVERFAEYAEQLDIRGKNDAAWRDMAQKLEREIILDRDLRPSRSAVTDENGTAKFSDIPMGLFLIIGSSIEKSGYVYATPPFFVMLPEQDLSSNTWNYHVVANAKSGQSPVTADYEVIKVWKDDCHKSQRPKTITIQLMCDGKAYGDPVTLPENGRWQHTWTGLDVNHKWTVTEATQKGYKDPEVRQEGNTFIVTNTCNKSAVPDSPSNPDLPQTGQLWWPVPVLLCAGALFVVVGLIRRRGSKDEA